MLATSIRPADLAFDLGGTPVSPAYGDIYHATQGGPGQARHVFLAGNGLPGRWAGRERFVILENGFGTGLNFLATWAAWLADARRPDALHYLALEKHPFRQEDLARLHAAWPEFAPLAARLGQRWPVLTPGFHRLEFPQTDGGRVVLTLMLGEAEDCLKQLRGRVDAFYLDGFDPKKNPAMWSPSLFQRLVRLAAPGATLATWCVARAVRDALVGAGFATEKGPGYAGKRDMLTGRLAAARHQVPPAAPAPERHALILGGGIAGCALAQRLAVRGWRVDLIERHGHLAGEGSGNLAGIVRPLLSRDDNIASRLNRACFLHARRAWADLEAAGFPSRRDLDGVLQIARDAAHEDQQRTLATAGAYPVDYVRFLDRDSASALVGWPTAFGGWWFPQGGWASPPTLCQALADAAGGNLNLHMGRTVAGLEPADGAWHALDEAGDILVQAPVAILASGAMARALEVAGDLPITPVRGQVSHVAAGSLPPFRHALCCEGYLTPAVDGIHCLGASYAYDPGTELRQDEHAGNLLRLGRILPGAEQALATGDLNGRVGFRAATPDRLPLAGALPAKGAPLAPDIRLDDMPRLPGLHGLLGLGSRGLVWATLAAEALASQLHGDPLPLEGDLLDAMDPARFLLRQHRRGRNKT
ncbi:MAG: bifunctional tRNA (5-methylaminomethyl-2-thiouridine)(34)-methyltransferase MnmD/FAD-dependent 5-carboxymethylaminomethyl-2-thiouridine(34) oxidoreductase MnmC [Thiobacillus sp.]|nr:bifunctional tRNA (5-methylaminomethyl-2-thiouridine)(34)-methyltransferase MnmD/FAD-dependent 5-carboxymethylaminomethyl-2-thiouridine(34) oxidoreductase MnmC [Thiobacillus sp.]